MGMFLINTHFYLNKCLPENMWISSNFKALTDIYSSVTQPKEASLTTLMYLNNVPRLAL